MTHWLRATEPRRPWSARTRATASSSTRCASKAARSAWTTSVAVTPDRWLSEGDTVTIGGVEFSVLHCPGHTPGHVVFVSKPLGFAIVGDVLFQGSVGRTDFPYGDTEELLTAIHDKLLPLGDEIAFICGHGPGSTFGEERHGNPFLQAGPI